MPVTAARKKVQINVQAGSAIAQAMRALSPGQFGTVSPSGASTASIWDSDGASHYLAWTHKMHYDAVRRRVHHFGKSENPNDDQIHIQLDFDSNAYSALSRNPGSGLPPNFTGTGGHPYAQSCITPTHVIWWAHGSDGTLDHYNLSTGSWSTPYADWGPNAGVAGCMDYEPTRDVFICYDQNVGLMTRPNAAGSWSQQSNSTLGIATLGTHPLILYNPVHDWSMLGGGNGGNARNHMIEGGTGTFSVLNDLPGQIGSNQNAKITYDPVTGNFLWFDWSTNAIYEHDSDPASASFDEWVELSETQPMANSTAFTLCALPDLGGILIFEASGASSVITRLYKHADPVWNGPYG